MKRNKIYASIAAVVLTASLTGCSLAGKDLVGNEDSAFHDRLIGVYVTQEPIDLFDFEGYANDHLSQLADGSHTIADTAGYEGRLYAELVEETVYDEENQPHTYWTYAFDPSLGGSACFTPTIAADWGDHVSTIIDDSISASKTHFISTDEEERIELEATLYICAGTEASEEYFVYINPVYQADDGSVYLTSGSGIGLNDRAGAGGVFTQTLSDSVTKTENDKSITKSAEIIFHVAGIYPPDKIVFLQMDREDNVLSKESFLPGTVPKAYPMQPDCAYLIISSHSTDMEGNPAAERTLYTSEDGYAQTLSPMDNGLCEVVSTNLGWQTSP